jgi:hypothetical protein
MVCWADFTGIRTMHGEIQVTSNMIERPFKRFLRTANCVQQSKLDPAYQVDASLARQKSLLISPLRPIGTTV